MNEQSAKMFQSIHQQQETVTMALDLYVFNMCPHCQRVRVALNALGLPCQLHPLDPANKPPAFSSLSPLGTVPVLRVDDQATLLDSLAINEYLNERGDGVLLPADMLARGVLRGWTGFASDIQGDMAKLLAAETEQALTSVVAAMAKKLRVLEGLIDQGILPAAPHPLTLLDAVMAPLFLRWRVIQDHLPIIDPGTMPHLHAWQSWLVTEPAVVQSVDGDFPALFLRFIDQRSGGALAARLDEE
ncbi:MAG: glutathione S-transferase family protein [Magnetococcales bacterium]|nr:glutathione S-transferase family protein [Magnetococcales bacterium]MBF0582983.1 glutathione S-transferase family protein [Magnetococcales bacterium]